MVLRQHIIKASAVNGRLGNLNYIYMQDLLLNSSVEYDHTIKVYQSADIRLPYGDFDYRNMREVVAAEIGVDSSAQSDAKGALQEFIEIPISQSLFLHAHADIEHTNSQCMERKNILVDVEKEDVEMITTPWS